MRPFLLPGLFAICVVPTVFAGETPWQNVAPDVSIRMISTGKVAADGKTLAALEIDMPEGTKTYWRVPGETGLPVELDFSASSGVESYQIFWPYPLREEKASKLDYVYYGHTILPMELALSDASADVSVTATLGICSEICVPARLSLTLPFDDAKPDAPNGLRIRQAMSEVPIEWTDSASPIGAVTTLPDQSGIALVVSDPAVDAASIIAATESGEPLFGAPQKSPHSDLVVLPILGKSDNSALEGMNVEVTFMTEMGAYAVQRSVTAGDVEGEPVPGE